MTGTHVQVSAAWLADRVRATASRIRSIPESWFSADKVAAALDELADELAVVPRFPPPLTGTTLPTSLTTPPTPMEELAMVLFEVRMALERQPMEPTTVDLLEVLELRMRNGTIPTRSMVEDPAWSNPDSSCTLACPLRDGAAPHAHGSGRISWT